MSLFYPSSEQAYCGKTSEREDRFTARFVELTPATRIVEAITFDSYDQLFMPFAFAATSTLACFGAPSFTSRGTLTRTLSTRQTLSFSSLQK